MTNGSQQSCICGQRSELEELARQAGEILLRYHASPDLNVADKSDGSPVTAADLEANEWICQGLRNIQPELPIISEESFDPQVDRSQIERYWLVDPLDGTKEFVRGSDEFTVNIALIEQQKAIAGVVYVPKKDEMFFACGDVLFRNGESFTPITTLPERVCDVVALVSQSHADQASEEFLQRHEIHQKLAVGSSLKFCYLTTGQGQLYLRFGPTSEWDTAAGQAVAAAAGFHCLSLEDLQPLRYSKSSIKNPGFLVACPSLIAKLQLS